MCYRPILLKDKGQYVPCSKCPQCISRKVSGWSFRLRHEARHCESSNFLTLTYDTRHVPILDSGHLNLSKRHLQLFFKRLRKAHGTGYVRSIKYYAVGEYGGKTQRPHYHVILFNAQLELINDAWNLGNIHYGTVTPASVGYTMKYMSKPKRWMKPDDPRQREFALMSKGLGLGYLTDAMLNYHSADPVNTLFHTIEDGKKISMPRYYKDKIYDSLQREAIREAFRIISEEKAIDKMNKQSAKDFRNEQKAIDAAYDKMHRSSLKTLI